MPTPTKTCSVFRHRDFLNLLADDLPLAQLVVNTFLLDTEQRMHDIDADLRVRQFEHVARHAHAIKGAAANLCADQVFEDAVTLERAAREEKLIPAITALNALAESHRLLHERVQALHLAMEDNRPEAA